MPKITKKPSERKPGPSPFNPMIGRTVWWFPRAERQVGPRAALVTGPRKAHPEGLLVLHVWEENSDMSDLRRNVRHINDPKLDTHPRMREQGGWDYVADSPSPPAESESPARPYLPPRKGQTDSPDRSDKSKS